MDLIETDMSVKFFEYDDAQPGFIVKISNSQKKNLYYYTVSIYLYIYI